MERIIRYLTRKEYQKQQWLSNHRITEDGVIERHCSKCDLWKEENINNFYLKNKSNPEKGFMAECIDCAIGRTIQNYTDNPQKKKDNNAKWNATNPEKRHKHNIKWFSVNKERRKAYMQWYQQTYPEKWSEYSKNKSQHKTHKINIDEWEACKKYFIHRCAYCGLKIEEHYFTRKGITKLGDFHKEHVDHFGENNLSNCVPSCGSCNSQKWEFLLDDWFNKDNPIFDQERYDRIIKWINGDYKNID